VRACNGAGNCGAYTTGGNPIVVSPAIPASITVPISSTGSNTISWGSSGGTITAYELYESTSAAFSSPLLVYQNTGSSTTLTGRANGTYYYRVRACNGATNCSDWRTGGNPLVVVIQPPSISVPDHSSDGAYTISWVSPGGTFDRYELYKASSPDFSGEAIAYSGLNINKSFSGETNGRFYFRVRICTGAICSALTVGANPIVIAYPPGGGPSSIQEVPTWDTDGNYALAWGSALGTPGEFYELYESTSSSFQTQTQVYSGPLRSVDLTGRAEGNYYYRVRACNQYPTSCGPYTTRQNVMAVTYPPAPPTNFYVPPTSNGTHTLTWVAPTNHYDGLLLQESLSPSFPSWTDIPLGTVTSVQLTGRATGTYYYRIQSRWSPAGLTSNFVEGANGTAVNSPPPVPGVPGAISINGGFTRIYQVSWGQSSGSVNHYTLKEQDKMTFPVPAPVLTNVGNVLSKSYTKPNTAAQYEYSVRACGTADESACSAYTAAATKLICQDGNCSGGP
jgi:hypothetical protein